MATGCCLPGFRVDGDGIGDDANTSIQFDAPETVSDDALPQPSWGWGGWTLLSRVSEKRDRNGTADDEQGTQAIAPDTAMVTPE